MRRVMVRYRVKPEHAEENERLVRAVYEELAAINPAGFRYRTIVLDDGVSFMHLADTEDGAVTPLPELASFQEFQREIRARCDEPPVVTEVREIGRYE